MKRGQTFAAGIASLALAATLLAGCGSNSPSGNEGTGSVPASSNDGADSSSNTNKNTNANAAEDDLFKDHLDISLAFYDIATSIKADQPDPMLQMIEQKFNITIKPVNESWGDYGDRTKLWAASGQLPDAFFFDQTSGDLVNQWADQGIIKPLPDDMSPYPNLKKYIDLPDVAGAAAADGKNYFIPRMLANRNELPMDRGIEIRKDWMDELGLQDPTTYDELKNVLKTIADKKHVIGLTAGGIGWIRESVFQNINPASAWWQKVNGQWQPGWMTDGYAEQIAQIRDLYQSGLLDKDFALPNVDAENKFMQGKAAALVTTPKTMNAEPALWNKANPNSSILDHVKILNPVPASDGKNYLYGYFDYWSGTLFSGTASDAKQERLLALMDWLASPEGQKVTRYGLQGVDWEPNGDMVTNKHQSEKDFDLMKLYPSNNVFSALAIWSDGNKYVEGYPATETGKVQEYIDNVEAEQLQSGEKPPINWIVNAFASSLSTGGGDLDALVTQLVIGKEDIKAAMKKYVDEQMGLGLADAIKAVNDKYPDEN
ncbi:extracellular solute-binding protein [Paenibacillus lycopersici]|uniref:Extracellular solute-binding protein n=1 Tax=Paenibacillus lycopersici TaxID=2704462 RepID=A0A6C0FVN0_9BACL|nr:extracellular solute-binding protein [Paenibacillus lycopersici]QHT61208.1 extracellular solute-binding protein [Paenibacillus lycopersici]